MIIGDEVMRHQFEDATPFPLRFARIARRQLQLGEMIVQDPIVARPRERAPILLEGGLERRTAEIRLQPGQLLAQALVPLFVAGLPIEWRLLEASRNLLDDLVLVPI